MKQVRNYAILFLVAGSIIGLDQWTKALVRANLTPGQTWLPAGWDWLSPYARIVHWYNTGAAFGSFQNFSWVFTILAFVVAGIIIYYYPQVDDSDWWLKLTLGLQLGGALGNVFDRLMFQGRVTDFISIGNFAVFNIADASITTGVAILILGVWIKEGREARLKAAETAVEKPEENSGE